MTAETDIAAIDDGGENTAAEVRTALTSVLGRADGGLVAFGRVVRTAGNISLSGTSGSWETVNSALDVTVAASEGDLLEMAISGLWGTVSVNWGLDAVTLVSGSPVTSLSNQTGTPADGGVSGWRNGATVSGAPITGSVTLVVGASDIASGEVTLRLRHRTGGGGTGAIRGDSGVPFQVWVKNYGQ